VRLQWLLVAALMVPAVPAIAGAETLAPDVFVVNKDGGGETGACTPERCTLRDAVNAAEASPNKSTIQFDIPDPDPIVLIGGTGLGLHNPTVIDGTTEPGYDGSHPVIEIDGSFSETGKVFLIFSGENRVELRGMAVYGAFDSQIASYSGDVLVDRMFVGTDGSGTHALGGAFGIVVFGNEDGPFTVRDSLVSGNGKGVVGNTEPPGDDVLTITGSLIGTDVTGAAALPGQRFGLQVCCRVSITGNVISGNTEVGLDVANGTGVISGNIIGLDANGETPVPNGQGVLASAIDLVIGGDTHNAGNLVAGNTGSGIEATTAGDVPDARLVIRHNLVGTDGEAALGNGKMGIRIGSPHPSSQSRAGAVVVDNVVAFNGGPGISVDMAGGQQNTLRRNVLYGNAGLGIDLWPEGVTPNDDDDADDGPNGLQNFPVILKAKAIPDGTGVRTMLRSTPNSSFIVDFYRVATCDPSGYGEADEHLGSTTTHTDANGLARFFTSLPAVTATDVLTASATQTVADDPGPTSELAACRAVE